MFAILLLKWKVHLSSHHLGRQSDSIGSRHVYSAFPLARPVAHCIELFQESLMPISNANIRHIGLCVFLAAIPAEVARKILALWMSLPAAPGRYQRWPSQCRFISISKPDWITLFRASSARLLCGSL
jgi:hypothetical protein